MNERDEMQARAETAPAVHPNVNKLTNAIERAIRNDGSGLTPAEVLTLAVAAEKFQLLRNDADFLAWLVDRLVNVYNENPDVDFVHKLRKLAGLE
jgi:hypothetical protein